MGLDMYLYKKVYIGANYEHNNVTGTIDIKKYGESLNIDLSKVSEITLSSAYWRKANAIHNWFVENVQSGNDDCGSYYVTVEQLVELRNLCSQVLANKELADELLPSAGGFSSASTDYDEYYFNQLQYTVEVLSGIGEEDYVSYEYGANW